MHAVMLPEAERDTKRVEESRASCRRHLALLEDSIAGDYLFGKFSVADVNVGSVINLVLRSNAAPGGPIVTAWMDRLRARPAYQRATHG
jgi:glutathione S-transferase